MTDSATQPGVDDGKGNRGKIDWEAVERDYCAGVLSTREIAAKYRISHTIINRRAKDHSWQKDLSAKVRERVTTALIALEVSNGFAGGNNGNEASGNKAQQDKETVEGAAQTVVGVIVSHRKDVNRGRALVATLMNQLSDATSYRETLRDLIEEETSGDRSPNRRMAMLRAVAIPAHASTVRDLAMAMKNLVAIERQAFNIDQSPEEEPPDANVGDPALSDAALVRTLQKLAELTGKPATVDATPTSPEAPAQA